MNVKLHHVSRVAVTEHEALGVRRDEVSRVSASNTDVVLQAHRTMIEGDPAAGTSIIHMELRVAVPEMQCKKK
jgi:hypothetical protein